ncbi:type VII secretion-associated serine protease mycosin, partial [Micromonospora zhanjiangensis]
MARRRVRLALLTVTTATYALVGGLSVGAGDGSGETRNATAIEPGKWTPDRPPEIADRKPESTLIIAGRTADNRLAAPTCGTGPGPAPAGTQTPWAQQRYLPDRLAALATGAGVTVAGIDSGVDQKHPQLRGRVAAGNDFLDPGGDGTRDCAGHGTGVASIIAAGSTTGTTFHGLAPGARILPVRVSEQQVVDGKESGRTVSAPVFARSIRWAVDHGADVINLSVVLYQDDPAVRAAVGYAVGRDVVVVAAAGNYHEQGNPTPYPAAYDGVLGVGAIGRDGKRAPFSQVGPYVDVVAPGSGILAAGPGRGQQSQEGTSYAAPFVSATAALVRQYRPELTAAQVAERIVATADPAAGGGGTTG